MNDYNDTKLSTKEKVLSALEKNKGNYVSGETLAGDCMVSRNAVWKSINELRKAGYRISSVNNRGYMLEEKSDIISLAGILLHLEKVKKAGAFEGRIFVYDKIDSTNTEAKRSIISDEDDLPHGTVIVARCQTAGRGHKGRSFSSPEGGIYFSLILKPEKMKKKTGPVTGQICRAVKEVLEKLYCVQLTAKTNGALYLRNEKVCGIMTEGFCDLETGIYSSYIAGIGIMADRLSKAAQNTVEKNEVIAGIISELI